MSENRMLCYTTWKHSTAKHFIKELGHVINESTIHSIKDAYVNACKKPKINVTALMLDNRSRPLLLG